MTHPSSRFFGGRSKTPDLSELKAEMPPPAYFRIYAEGLIVVQGDACAKCGGFFQLEFLKLVHQGTVILSQDGNVGVPHFETVYYCQGCEPPASIVFVLQDDKGRESDTRYFQVEDGWFQDIDKESGEERYTVSIEEYNHTFCTICGELIEETECQDHRTPAKKGKK